MNSALPVLAGVKEGWLPKFLIKQNKRGAYWVAILIIFVVGSLPICIGLSVAQITNMTIVLGAIGSSLALASGFLMPKRFPNEWKESWLHVPSGVYSALMVLCGCVQAYVIVKSLMDLTLRLAITNVAVLAVAFFYGLWRMRTVVITETDFV
jgi:APA family basic amino acid/polyamine antiporter